MSVFYLDNHPAIAEITENLLRLGVNVSHVQTGYTKRFKANARISAVKLLDIRDSRHCHRILKLNKKGSTIPPLDLLDQFVECETVFYDVLDRIRFKPLSIIERRRLYFNLLVYWNEFFDRNPAIDMVVLRDPPHIGYDIVIYYIAKSRDIKVVYFDNTSLDGYVLARTTKHRLKKVEGDQWRNLCEDGLQDQIGAELTEKVYQMSSVRNDFNKKNLELIQRSDLVSAAVSLFVGVQQFIKQLASCKKRNFTFTDCEGGDKGVLYFKRKQFRYLLKNHLYKRTYKRLVKMPALNPKYILFTLHLQPECSTSPFVADSFQDQVLAIELLSSVLPKEWVIYVKEHPMNHYSGLMSAVNDELLNSSLAKVNYVDKRNYQRLQGLNNVVLVSTKSNTKELLNSAQAVATVTGTSGWEALIMGVSCIAFGRPWYGACNSCYEISSTNELINALENIRHTTPDKVERDAKEYLALYRKKFIDVGDFIPPGYDDSYKHIMAEKSAQGIKSVIDICYEQRGESNDYISVR